MKAWLLRTLGGCIATSLFFVVVTVVQAVEQLK